jgi:hypothetical protein
MLGAAVVDDLYQEDTPEPAAPMDFFELVREAVKRKTGRDIR